MGNPNLSIINLTCLFLFLNLSRHLGKLRQHWPFIRFDYDLFCDDAYTEQLFNSEDVGFNIQEINKQQISSHFFWKQDDFTDFRQKRRNNGEITCVSKNSCLFISFHSFVYKM